MKIKTPTEFVNFRDGVCKIYALDGTRLCDLLMERHFEDRTVGMKRYYAAKGAGLTINKLVYIRKTDLSPEYHAVVIGNTQYRIEQVQHFRDTNPPVTALTLRKTGDFYAESGDES